MSKKAEQIEKINRIKYAEYQITRNSLIPTAEKIANKICGVTPRMGRITSREIWADYWNMTFHGAMNKLVKEAGL